MGTCKSKDAAVPQQSPQKRSALLKSVKSIPTPPAKVQFICVIPERNLLLALALSIDQQKTLYIFNTTNFKLILTKKLKENVQIICYSKELKKIIVGGFPSFLQIWNPTNFKIEAQNEYSPIFSFTEILSLTYIPISGVVILRDIKRFYVFDKSLKFLTIFGAFEFENSAAINEVFGISKHHILVGNWREMDKRLTLLNLRKKITQKVLNISVPITSRIELIQETPKRIFACLAKKSAHWKNPTLIQFTVDSKTKYFHITHKVELMDSVDQIWRIQNSQFFIVGKFDNLGSFGWFGGFLLSVEKGKVEILRCIVKPQEKLSGFDKWIMMKNREIVRVDKKLGLNLLRLVIKKENPYELKEDNERNKEVLVQDL